MPPKINNATEIFDAVEKNDIETLKRLVEIEGVILKSTTDKDYQTAAHIATHHGNFPILTYLLKTDIHLLVARDKSNESVLHIAAKKGHLAIIKYLVDEMNVDLNLEQNRVKGNTAMHMAAEAGHLPIVKWYIEEFKHPKGNPNLRNEDGETLMIAAAKKGHLDIVKYLAHDGMANPVLTDYYDGNILFHSAVIGDLSVPKYLLEEAGVVLDVDWKNIFGMTVVFMATRFNQLEFVKYFVEKQNATIEIANNMGWTPLHEAANEGHFELVKYLVENKAAWGREEMHGKTPAEVSKSKEIIDYLKAVEVQRRAEYEEYERSRMRRSVPDESVAHNSQNQRAPTQELFALSESSLFHAGPQSKTVNGIGARGLDGFLLLVGASVKTLKKERPTPVKHRSLLPPPELLRERMDPLAFEAIDAGYRQWHTECN